MTRCYKIIHPAWIGDYVAVNAPKRAWRYANARDVDAPVVDAYDRRNGCVVIAIDGAAP